MNSDEARTIAREAYIFHYPMVMMYRTMYIQSIDSTSSSYSGGFGQWLHLGMSTPKDTDIVSPNNDSPYSYAWVDLRAEPWVLTMPAIEGGRFYTSQWDDLWGFVLDNPGSVNDGNDGVRVLLASPTWDGDLPDGVNRVVRGDTDFLGTLTRTQAYSADDLSNVQRIQQAYKLQALSEYLGVPSPAPAPVIDWMPWQDGAEQTEDFWKYANFLLSFATPNPQDADVQERAALIGVGAGRSWDPEALGADVQSAIAAGLQDALDELKEGSTTFDDPSLFFRSREDLDRDYWNRALGVYVGLFGNVKAQSIYFAVPKDDQGELLDGSTHSYELVFAADTIPPVKYFWSWTMYRLPQRWLVDNEIDRYSIGSATPGLGKGDDGSITLHFSTESPGKDKETNWLPAPDGPFWLVLRTYGPGDSIQDGSYQLPPVTRTR